MMGYFKSSGWKDGKTRLFLQLVKESSRNKNLSEKRKNNKIYVSQEVDWYCTTLVFIVIIPFYSNVMCHHVLKFLL